MAAIYSVYTSPQHAPIPGHLPTLIVTPHGSPHQILYTYLHTEENRVNYLLTPSDRGDLCVAKLFPPDRNGSSPTLTQAKKPPKFVRCEASRDLRWTIENTGVVSPIYKIVNQDDTPLYQISKPNPNAEFWTMFYFKYAGHQIPPKRIEFGKVSKNSPERGGGTRISISGKTEDEKQVWQTLGVGNEDCVEWVVACSVLNLLDDEILRHAEKKTQTPNPNAPAATVSASSPASTRPNPALLSRMNGGPSGRPPIGAGIASTGAPPASNLAAAYRNNPPPHMRTGQGPPQQQMNGRPPVQQQGMYDPRTGRAPPGQPQLRGGYAPQGRRF